MAKKVFLGVGHGGTDPGASANGLKEKDVNLGIALAAREHLERAGVEVRLSRYKDEDDSLAEEIRECNTYGPDLAVDVHNNAGGGDGFEAYCSLVGGVSRKLAENIERQVLAAGQNSRGVKTRPYPGRPNLDYYGFVRETKAPAVLCEFAFLDTPDRDAVDSPADQEKMGKALAMGILDTLGIPWRRRSGSATPTGRSWRWTSTTTPGAGMASRPTAPWLAGYPGSWRRASSGRCLPPGRTAVG